MDDWEKKVENAVDTSLSTELEDNLIGSESIFIGINHLPTKYVLCVVVERDSKIVVIGHKEFSTRDDLDTYMEFLRANYKVENVVEMEDDEYDKHIVFAMALAVEAHKQIRPTFHLRK